MTLKSDTPFTDAYEHNMGSVTEPHYVVDADKMRGLERELAALKAENERLQAFWDYAMMYISYEYKTQGGK